VIEPAWAVFVPRGPWRLPGGYCVEFRIVSESYVRQIRGSAAWGVALDFGETVRLSSGRWLRLPEKIARIYLSREMSYVRFCHVFFHEVNHTMTEWSGHMHNRFVEHMEGIA
jgi:hypothetical protein